MRRAKGWHGQSRRHAAAARKGWAKRRGQWISGAVKQEGALSRQLDIPEDENIPITLLTKIKNTPIGETITNPTQTGRERIKVTRLLKQRAVLAHTLKTLEK